MALISGISSTGIEVAVSLQTILITLGVALCSGCLLALPSLSKLKRLQPSQLFQEAARPGSQPSRFFLLYALPGLSGFWILCLVQSHSDKLANIFFLPAFLVRSFCSTFSHGLDLEWGKNFEPLPSFHPLSHPLTRPQPGRCPDRFFGHWTGRALTHTYPPDSPWIEQEIGLDDPRGNLPSLSLFDLQEEQLEGVKMLLEKEGAALGNVTPWVRGRIISLKGKPYERSLRKEEEMNNPDEQRRNAFRNRSFNLSYRDHLLESEQLLAGRPFSGIYEPGSGKAAEISVEHKYADALGLGLGDTMGIEVAGIPINAVVVNLRRVRWTSFQPNFFVQMQPGVLDQAPKTFLGTLHHLNQQAKESLQNKLVQKFPTVSILDVERTGKRFFMSLVK